MFVEIGSYEMKVIAYKFTYKKVFSHFYNSYLGFRN